MLLAQKRGVAESCCLVAVCMILGIVRTTNAESCRYTKEKDIDGTKKIKILH